MMKIALTTLVFAIAVGLGAWALCFSDVSTLKEPPIFLVRWNDEVYGLDQQETIRFIPAPFLLHRPVEYRRFLTAGSNFSSGQLVYNVSKDGKVRRAQTLNVSGTVLSALTTCGWEKSRFEGLPHCVIDSRLAAMRADGDWLLDDYAPQVRRMQALASILSAVSGRDLVIERRPTARQTSPEFSLEEREVRVWFVAERGSQ